MSFTNPVAFPSAMSTEHKPPSWMEWVERNAKPIKRIKPKEEIELTPWQKKGPMKKKDWKRFYTWAETKAWPKDPVEVVLPEIPCDEPYLPCAKPPREMDWLDLKENAGILAIPLERKKREKYVAPDPDYTFKPAIVWGEAAELEKGRPFAMPDVPKCFANDDVKSEFWYNYRFPLSKGALTARASPRIISLAKPRVKPPFPHCPIPEREPDPLDGEPPKRKKFTPRGWRLHQVRLVFLSKPVNRPEFNYFYL